MSPRPGEPGPPGDDRAEVDEPDVEGTEVDGSDADGPDADGPDADEAAGADAEEADQAREGEADTERGDPEPDDPEPDDPEPDEPDPDELESGDAEPDESRPADAPLTSPGRRWRWLAAGAGAALLASLLFFVGGAPDKPLDDLRLGEPGAAEVPAVSPEAGRDDAPPDPEQLALLERQRRRAAELAETTENIEEQAGVTLTDRSLVRDLAGRWRLDLGRRKVIADFAPTVVDRVRRGSLLVELYPVDSRDLPPFYTVFELPDRGPFIAFRAADGSYRLVLEEVRFHGPDLFSFDLGSGPRRNAYRLRGAVLPEALDRGDRAGEEAGPGAEAQDPVRLEIEPPPPVEEMWRRAEALRDEGRLDSLEVHLRRLLAAYPRHRQARRWQRRIDRWIAEQRDDLVDELGDELADLAEAVRDRDLDEIFESWGDRPDAATRRFFSDLLARHRRLDARVSLHRVDIDDGVVEFSATVTLEGWSGRQRDREIIPRSWRGRFADGRFLTPFL